MNVKPVDKSKKSNIKCEHCAYWNKNRSCHERGYSHLKYCGNANSGRIWTAYWNRCKAFAWKGGARMREGDEK